MSHLFFYIIIFKIDIFTVYFYSHLFLYFVYLFLYIIYLFLYFINLFLILFILFSFNFLFTQANTKNSTTTACCGPTVRHSVRRTVVVVLPMMSLKLSVK